MSPDFLQTSVRPLAAAIPTVDASLMQEPFFSEGDILQAAWRMLEAADTRCLSQVESPGFQALLRRVREASRDAQASVSGSAINSLEDLAQLLALWRPGAFSKTEEQSYLAARFGGQRPTYFHPALGAVLEPTHGELLYGDQVAALLRGLGFDYEWADRGPPRTRHGLARAASTWSASSNRAEQRRWTDEQINAVLALLQPCRSR